MAYFEPATQTEEMIALAWKLEEGSRKFYGEMIKREKDQKAVNLFQELSKDEERHQSSLEEIFKRQTGKEPDSRFFDSLLAAKPGEDYLEGGIRLVQALEWLEGKKLQDVLELAVSLEADAIDLYIKMERKAERQDSKEVFQALSNQEAIHLDRLGTFREKI